MWHCGSRRKYVEDCSLSEEIDLYPIDEREDMELHFDPDLQLVREDELLDLFMSLTELDEPSSTDAYKPYLLGDIVEEIEKRGMIVDSLPEEPWACTLCGHINQEEDSHCQICGISYREGVYDEPDYDKPWEVEYWHGACDEEHWMEEC